MHNYVYGMFAEPSASKLCPLCSLNFSLQFFLAGLLGRSLEPCWTEPRSLRSACALGPLPPPGTSLYSMPWIPSIRATTALRRPPAPWYPVGQCSVQTSWRLGHKVGLDGCGLHLGHWLIVVFVVCFFLQRRPRGLKMDCRSRRTSCIFRENM